MNKHFTIIQGTNKPIKIDLDEDVSDSIDISAVLFDCYGAELKHWYKDDITIDEDALYLPLSQNDTLWFPAGVSNYIELKRTASDGTVIPYARVQCIIEERNDKYELKETPDEGE